MVDFIRGLMGVAVAAMVAASLGGCGCGVGAAPGPNNDNGVVTFAAVPVGSSTQLQVPFQDSADTDETILGASISGPDAAAFAVIATYPIPLPAGTQVALEIRFTPTHTGPASATVVLQTENMGPSPVQLAGSGE
jgi:hypothetical protein